VVEIIAELREIFSDGQHTAFLVQFYDFTGMITVRGHMTQQQPTQ